jgi:hypothetical protein
MTVVGAISLSYESIIPLFILKGEVWKDSWVPPDVIKGVHANFTCAPKAYINTPIWEGFLSDSVVPKMDEVRVRLNAPHA